ncbi:hypothetical protein G8O24_10395 [Bradyrhizobium sp. INPA01-394B]|uniref:Semialdehyde dehydrogenase NAD-binding domain-containing protein n=1 Tax=Bradyrhizobium campsiandrae TaxID=1729892 RepID=A0ABR7U2W4_9BRAD|nr:hypothetical protein [Bradyrhizobium campsiandrae]MBC9977697.1 hypothetical protein [Bradyrhizobium campsiandrae]
MRVIGFGATGMVGQGVLREYLIDAPMIQVARLGYPKKVLEMKDINRL